MQRGILLATILLILLLFAGMLLTYFSGKILVPILMTPRKILPEIINAMHLKPGQKLYDLGSGDSRVLVNAVRHHNIKAYGFELSPILTYIDRVKRWFSKKLKGEIEITTDTFFKSDLANADHIYCYLNQRALQALLPKFKKELKKSALIYSYKNRIEGLKDKKEIILSNSEVLYIYSSRELK